MLLISIASIFCQNIFSQTTTSIANGVWLSPFTWSCTCVPLPGSNVTINHHVTLNTSFQIPSSGSITVNNTGTLVQDSARDILMNGGAFVNHGTVDFRYLLLQTGSFTNTDTLRLKSFANYGNIFNSGVVHQVDSFFNVGYMYSSGIVATKKFQNNDTLINDGLFTEIDSFYNLSYLLNNDSIIVPAFFSSGTFINNGAVTEVDSFVNAGMLTNNLMGIINADSMLNTGTLNNHGSIHNIAFANTGNIQNTGIMTFYDAFNLNQFFNNHSISGLHSFWNTGKFTNATGGVLHLDADFLNADSIQHDASFFNNGTVVVDGDWFNADTVSGVFGSFVVADSSGNSGKMLGSFDFCDLTPPASSPFIDSNTGIISVQITWCNPQSPQADFTSSDVCLGNSVQFSNTSTGAITSLQWDFGDGSFSAQTSPLHLYLASGTYSVKLLITNGTVLDSITHLVTVHPLPATPQPTLSNNTIDCNVTASAYHWYLDGILQNGLNTQSFNATQTGYYSVKITDSNGCISDMSDSVFVNITSLLALQQNITAWDIFPNPFRETTAIRFCAANAGVVNLVVYNITGQKIYQQQKTVSAGVLSQIEIRLPKNTDTFLIYELQLNGQSYFGKIIQQ